MASAETHSTIRSVDRAIDVLLAFTVEHPELTLGDISERVSLSKPTTFRLLSSLRTRGFIIQEQRSGKYSLGFGVLKLAVIRRGQTRVWERAAPHMRTARDALDETILLCVRVGDERYILDQVESTQPIRRIAHLGERVPLYAGAASKVLLAAMPDDDIAAYLARTSLRMLGPGTITEPELMMAEVSRIRELGYAVGRNERNIGGNGIAVPVRDFAGDTVAALQTTIPSERWDDSLLTRCVAVLAGCAADLSGELGHQPVDVIGNG